MDGHPVLNTLFDSHPFELPFSRFFLWKLNAHLKVLLQSALHIHH